MHLLVFLLLCGQPGISPVDGATLTVTFKASSELFDPEYFSVVNNGELFLVNDYHRLLAFDSHGGSALFELIPEPEGENPYVIANYAHFRWNGYRLLVLNLREDNEPTRLEDVVTRIHIYDLDLLKDQFDGFLGYGLDSRKEDPRSAYFRQILSIGNRQYVNLWDHSFVGKDRVPILNEVVLEQVDGGFEFRLVGKPFHEMRRAFNPFGDNMKRRFIAPDPAGGAIVVSHQLQEDLWVYGETAQKRQMVTDLRRLKLDEFVPPYAYPGPRPSEEWITSFSQTTGLYAVGGDLLIGYLSPNPEHPYYAAEFGKKEVPDAPRHVLHLQLLVNGKRKAPSEIALPGGFLMGIDEQKTAFVFQQTKTSDLYEISRVRIR
jgi:hypothetical protein